jgi:hypothetical protein
MSATDVPILDPRNHVEYRVPAPYWPGGFTISDWTQDPVAKVRCSLIVGKLEDGQKFAMEYMPGLDLSADDARDGLALQSAFQDMASKNEYALIMSAYYWSYVHEDIFICETDLKHFAGFEGERVYGSGSLNKHENDPGYEFWPRGVPGRDQAVAVYFLNCLLLHWQRAEIYYVEPRQLRSMKWSSYGVAIDDGLADIIGLEHFPGHERLPNGNILILQGERVYAD